MESLNQAENSLSEPISSISEQIQPSACVYTHAHTHARTHSRSHNAGAYAHERAHTRTHNAHIYAQMHSISKANWIGTAVPISGYVENVYYNTNLSVEDAVDILDTLTMYDIFDSGETITNYIVFVSQDQASALNITRWENIGGYNSYMIGVRINNVDKVIFRSFDFQEESAGWYESEELYFDTENFLSVFAAAGNFETQNDKLSALFSITPFEQSSDNELSIGNLFTQLGNAIIIFGGAVVNVFISMEPIFWNNGPTLIFILLIASVSFALVFWGIELLISLIGVFKTKRKKKK